VVAIALVALVGGTAYALTRPRPHAVVGAAPAGAAKGIDLAAFDKAGLKAISAQQLVADGGDGIKIGTFLGNESRRFYGIGPVPEKLQVIWKNRIGTGKTSGTASATGTVTWGGTGWTGQPTLVRDGGKLYVLIGGFDHGLRKIDAKTGKTVWRYEYDDVIKGTNTVFINPNPRGAADRIVVVDGSRKGWDKHLGAPGIAPLRAVSFTTGKELWRLPVPRTRSYSQDADGSGILIGSWFYQPVESGYLYRLDPSRTQGYGTKSKPVVKDSLLMFEKGDAGTHGGNLVLESSPAILDGKMYVAAGSGHIYGVRIPDLKKIWDFRTGSDLDSSIAVTKRRRLLCGIEKQYIAGNGGLIMLDPSKPAARAVDWYFPTGNRNFVDWEGGVIGSPSINDEYNSDGSAPALAAVSAIDGNLYVVSQDKTTGKKVKGFDGKTSYPTPVLVFKDYIGGSISTPIIVGNHIVAAGYDAKVHVYRITYGKAGKGVTLPSRDGSTTVGVKIKEVASFRAGAFESTPIVWNGRVYIGSRNGYFYCLGVK
jgi:outer membrane protein assembly factor BamB